MDDQNKTQPVVVEREKKSHTGLIVTVVLVILLILFAIYALPALFGGGGTTNTVEVTPAPSATGQ